MAADSDTKNIQSVDIWVDPRCPWAWITSQWLGEVEKVRKVETNFHIMSLSVINEGKEVPEEYRQAMIDGWACVRVCVAAGEQHGSSVVGPLYKAMARRIHQENAGLGADMISAALSDTTLPAELADAANDSEIDAALRDSTRIGMEPVGAEVGTPVLHIATPDSGSAAFFGPVLTPVPRGEAAGRLWDGISALASTDEFFEIKRSRTRDPQFD